MNTYTEDSGAAMSETKDGGPALNITREAFEACLREAFDVGCHQGNDEASAYDWGSRPSKKRDEAFAEILEDWNTDCPVIRMVLRSKP